MTFGYVKIHKRLVTIFTSIRWEKPAWPAKPMLLTSTLLVEALPGDAGWCFMLYMKFRFHHRDRIKKKFSFKDLVKQL